MNAETSSTDLFYFSGTGNSLHVARELAARIPRSQVRSMVSCLSKGECVSSAEVIGLVFPVHALTLPIVVKKFLEKLEPSAAQYVFVAATRQGTVFHGFRKIAAILGKKGRSVNAEFLINMFGNDSRHRGFQVPTAQQLQEMETQVQVSVARIAECVGLRRDRRVVDSQITVPTASNRVASWLIETLVVWGMDVAERVGGVNYFFHNQDCNGCGICEKVCPSQKITLQAGGPVWEKKQLCYMCFACLNFCPVKSVQIRDIPGVKSFTATNGRYPHPYATVKVMVDQKA